MRRFPGQRWLDCAWQTKMHTSYVYVYSDLYGTVCIRAYWIQSSFGSQDLKCRSNYSPNRVARQAGGNGGGILEARSFGVKVL